MPHFKCNEMFFYLIYKIKIVAGTQESYINQIETNDNTLKNTFFDGAKVAVFSKIKQLDIYEDVMEKGLPLKINENYRQIITISDGEQPNYTTFYLKVVLENPTENTKVFISISQAN